MRVGVALDNGFPVVVNYAASLHYLAAIRRVAGFPFDLSRFSVPGYTNDIAAFSEKIFLRSALHPTRSLPA